jgi:hypothetical protein
MLLIYVHWSIVSFQYLYLLFLQNKSHCEIGGPTLISDTVLNINKDTNILIYRWDTEYLLLVY